MPPSDRHAILFEPVQIGPKTLRNRFYQVPHGTGYGTLKPASLASYRAMRAEGGWAAVNTEWAPIGESSDEWPYISARIWDAEDARRLSATVDQAHAHGALVGIELHHGGAISQRRESRWHALSPSGLVTEVPPPVGPPETPKAMDRDDIEAVQQGFVDAAIRARDVGFDIIYVYASCGFLLAQFLSPFHNKRTDEYGGSVENRARMWVETIARVRQAVGADCAVATRIAADSNGPWGHAIAETLQFVEMADEFVDLFDVNMAAYLNMDTDVTASRFFAEGHNLQWIGQVRKATAKPIVGVSRLSNPDLMADVVRSGALDLIGAARQSIADPFLPEKIEQGRTDEIRECMGINVCFSRLLLGHLGCAQNATAGEEYRRGWHPEKFSPAANRELDALVVGAGPAGMECAIVLAKRGLNRVHLVDAEQEPGGIMRWIPRLPGLGEWARFVNHRRIQIEKLKNLDFIPGLCLDAEAVREYGAEIVVVATGARWAADGLSPVTHEPLAGADASRDDVFTPEQLMVEGQRPAPGTRIAVYDAEGYFMAAGIAQLLDAEGYEVSIVTPFEQIAPQCDTTEEGRALRKVLHGAGIAFHRGVTLRRFAAGGIEGEDEFGEPVALEAESLVLVTQRLPGDSLYTELACDRRKLEAADVRGLHRVGDCLSPRMLADTVFDGHRLGREIDSEHPERPLPYRREALEPDVAGIPLG
ncbi:MAG: FAD-dependent oxidoreductase [Solirubrobacterales bacterium]